jgi:hypothetical protein
VQCADGRSMWFIDGIEISSEEHHRLVTL